MTPGTPRWVGFLPAAALAAVLALAVPYSSGADPSGPPRAVEAPVDDTLNTLTEEERAAGWRLLFDGRSTDGWRGYRRDSMPGGWTVEDDALHFEGEGPGYATIVTTETFEDFELRIDWRISPGGNSGIMYRVTEEADYPFQTGPEFQVLDNTVPHDPPGTLYQAGALYGLYAADEDVTRSLDRYNEARIVVRGIHVEHWMNGTKLLEAEIGSGTWKERVSGSKFEGFPAFAEAREGHLALQDHGHPVWYRNIELRRLEPER